MQLYIKNIDRTKIESDSLKEYLAIKDKKNDCIIFFQMGSFIEAFFEDAKIVSSITGAALGSRSFKGIGQVAQCGFPIKNDINLYIKQLLSNNYKICLCLEFKDEENKSYRKEIRTYTSGTIIENEFLESSENNYILSLYKNDKTIELAYADTSTGQFYKTEGELSEIQLEIERIEPNEIIILDEQKNIFDLFLTKYPLTIAKKSPDKTYDSQIIIEDYCKETQKAFCIKLDKIKPYKLNNYMVMDQTTRKNLELTRTKMFSKKKGSLIWFLNNTKTPMGARLLKQYISEPLLNIEKIKERQEAIDELIKNKEQLKQLEDILENFCDLSRICARITNSTIIPKDLLRIALNSEPINELVELSKTFNSNILKLNNKKLPKIIELSQKIKSAIKENAGNKITGGDIIKEGYNADLDYLNSKLEETKKRFVQYEAKEQKTLEIDKLKIDSSNLIGFYIEIPKAYTQKAGKDYLKKQSLNNCSRYTTQKLNELEQEFYGLKYKINKLEHELFCELRNESAIFVENIRALALDVAKIDVMASLARCAIENNLTKPKFNNNKIYIENGYHPSLIKLKNEIVKNDTDIQNDTMIILTGANMSGKSTYLKHNAIICLLSQIGSFIPADYADIAIVNKLFLRQGSTDDIINNNSSFMVEMNDLKFILDNITNESFVLLDEPAKSTNEKEGGAIARAFCEYLLSYYKAKTIIATHNNELTKLENDFPNKAINLVIGEINPQDYTINRKVKRGIAKTSSALCAAKLANLPEEIINKAESYSK